MSLSAMQGRKKRIAKKTSKNKKKKNVSRMARKMIRVIRTFRVKQWQIGIDTGDYGLNARLYPVNFLPAFYSHVNINFIGENFFFIQINNNAWRMVYAFLR